MAQWGSNDNTSNSVIWAPTSVKLAPNSANRDALFNNANSALFTEGATVGTYGVDGNEVGVNPAIPHTGHILRIEGSGGRAGRVHHEVLVAGGITGDANDDVILPDS